MSGIAIGLFFGLGFILSLVGGIWGLVQAFQEHVIWGVVYLVIPLAFLVFYAKKWSNLKIRKAFLIQLGGWLMFLLGSIIYVVTYGTEFTKISQSGTITIQPESTEQSPSSFPSDFSISSSPTPEQSPSSESSPQLSPAPIAEPTSGTVGAQKDDFTKSMKLGYAYYGQGDYQTALINFNRALQVRPDDAYAIKAVRNTKSAIAGRPNK